MEKWLSGKGPRRLKGGQGNELTAWDEGGGDHEFVYGMDVVAFRAHAADGRNAEFAGTEAGFSGAFVVLPGLIPGSLFLPFPLRWHTSSLIVSDSLFHEAATLPNLQW